MNAAQDQKVMMLNPRFSPRPGESMNAHMRRLCQMLRAERFTEDQQTMIIAIALLGHFGMPATEERISWALRNL